MSAASPRAVAEVRRPIVDAHAPLLSTLEDLRAREHVALGVLEVAAEDHVLVGRWNGSTTPDPSEVSETRWVAPDSVLREFAAAPGRFTVWMREVVERACVDRGRTIG